MVKRNNVKKILITGGTGLFATNALYLLKDKFELFSVSQRCEQYLDWVNVLEGDLTDRFDVKRILDKVKPDLIINAAGLTSVEACEENFYKAYLSNVVLAKNIAIESNKRNIKLVHISTDHFSDSNIFKSNEEQIEAPRNIYASTKLEGERAVLNANSEALVVRTNFYGWGSSFRGSFSDYIINELRAEREVKLFDDVFFNPILADELLSKILAFVENKSSGTFNLCGSESLTKHEFGVRLAKVFGLDTKFILKDKLSKRDNLVSRPFDMSLCTKKITNELKGAKLYSLEESFRLLKNSEDRKNIFLKNIRRKPTNLSYGKHDINENDISSVVNVLCNRPITQGGKVVEFEDKLKELSGAKYAVAVSTWTSGLHMAILALGIEEGDSIITSPISFVASSNCALYEGADAYFADIDSETLNIDLASVEKICIEKKNVKAVIPVHFGGAPCDMEGLKLLSKKYDFKIIEDAAHAVGGQYADGSSVGSCKYSEFSGFSFHPVKNIACGEGGVLFTNSHEMYLKLLRLRSHGINKIEHDWVNKEEAYTDGRLNSWFYEMVELGYNYRITDIQCALGLSQLERLSDFKKRRIEIGQKYDEAFNLLQNVKVVQDKTRHLSGNHLYVIKINYEKIGVSRLDLMDKLREGGINGHVHYIPIPMQPYYKDLYPEAEKEVPNAIEYYRNSLTLPMYPTMTDVDIERVINLITSLVG
jgi:UDP-4-amino-4,6-dideoxy-N-acetyl-beta-L-altrosamine transaminase